MPLAELIIFVLGATTSVSTLAVINASPGEAVITGNEIVAIKTCALMAEEPDEKLRIALTILPATGLPTLEANAPLGQPVMLFTITGGPNTRLL
jgi:hypothetical protein